MITRSAILATILALGATTCAEAGSVAIDAGGKFTIQAGDLSSSVFGGSDAAWSTASLASTHAALRRSGIETNGKVTIAAANTSHGLSLLVLVDEALANASSPVYGNLGMISSASGANISHVADASKNAKVQPITGASFAADVTYKWNANGSGEGFAWTGLEGGDALSFRFQRSNLNLGLEATSTFQFVSWNGSAWEIARGSQNSFDGRHQFGFSADVIQTVVVPTPTALALGGVPLALLGMTRRRRVS